MTIDRLSAMIKFQEYLKSVRINLLSFNASFDDDRHILMQFRIADFAQADVDRIKTQLGKFGFDVEIVSDKTAPKILVFHCAEKEE